MHDALLPGQQDMGNRRKDPSGLLFSGTRLTYKDDGVAVHCDGETSVRTRKVKIQAPTEGTHLPPAIETAHGKQPLRAAVRHQD